MCTELDTNRYGYESTSTRRRVKFGSGYQYKGESPRNSPPLHLNSCLDHVLINNVFRISLNCELYPTNNKCME